MSGCREPGCTGQRYARDLCHRCYERELRRRNAGGRRINEAEVLTDEVFMACPDQLLALADAVIRNRRPQHRPGPSGPTSSKPGGNGRSLAAAGRLVCRRPADPHEASSRVNGSRPARPAPRKEPSRGAAALVGGDPACAGLNPDLFHPVRGENATLAKTVCRACPVQADCLAWALATNEKRGIWGGRSERERRDLANQRGRTDAA